MISYICDVIDGERSRSSGSKIFHEAHTPFQMTFCQRQLYQDSVGRNVLTTWEIVQDNDLICNVLMSVLDAHQTQLGPRTASKITKLVPISSFQVQVFLRTQERSRCLNVILNSWRMKERRADAIPDLIKMIFAFGMFC
jgi:hypothetical protein